ncbi:MAG: flagellin [Deltaproteobacteria bacterium]|nr:flagellin [Deltaproteobacteria bacterium]
MIQITDNMIYNNINNELLNQSAQIYNLQDQISSGLQINYPQDNPAGMVSVLSYKNSASLINQYNSNVNLANEISSLASSTLNNVIGVVNQAKTLAIEMANGGTSASNQSSAAQEVKQIINELLQSSNTSYNGQNIFTGENLSQTQAYTSSQAFYNVTSSNGTITPVKYNVYTYAGTDVNQRYQITQNQTIAPSLTADAVFGNDPANQTASYNPSGLISVLSLFQSELSSGVYQSDSQNIISGISNGLNQILSAQSTLGTKVQRLNEQSTSYQTVLSNITQLLGQTENVNIPQAMTSLTQAQDSYQATLQTAAGITQLTPMLLKYL